MSRFRCAQAVATSIVGVAAVAFAVVPAGAVPSVSAPAGTEAEGNGPAAQVFRWWQPEDGDWLTVPVAGSHPSDSQLIALGYTRSSAAQYSAVLTPTGSADEVAVYRWWHHADQDWIDIADGSIPDSTMIGYGYTNKTLQYYASTAPAGGRVAINRWWNAADRDWMTLREGEIPDASLAAWGYTDKALVAHVLPAEAEALRTPPPDSASQELVHIDSPAEGDHVTSTPVVVSGTAAAAGTSLAWRVVDVTGTELESGVAVTTAGVTTAVFEFSADLYPGTYTVEVVSPDPSSDGGTVTVSRTFSVHLAA